METTNTVILGAGLVGLGCAIGLKKEGQTVMVLEKLDNPFRDNSTPEVRYIQKYPASYKSAGMMELYVASESVLNYFMQ